MSVLGGRVSAARAAAWAGIVVAIVYLMFIGGTWSGIYFAVLRAPTMVIAGAGLAAWAATALLRPTWLPRSGMFPAMAACLATLGISTVFSQAPRVSIEYLGYGIVLAALYLILVRLLRDEYFRSRLVNLVVMLFAVLSIVYLVVVVTHWVEWWTALGHLATPPLRPFYDGLMYGNPSTLLALVLLLGMSVVGAKAMPSPRGRAVLGLVVVAIAFVAVASGSRAGWLAIALSTVTLSAWWLAFGGGRARAIAAARAVLGNTRTRLLVLLAGAVALALGMFLIPAVLQRVLYGGEDLRAAYLIAALRLFAQSPLVGIGPGTWAIERGHATAAGEPDYYVPHAHNIEMQTASELGIVGLIAGLFLLLELARLLRNGLADGDSTRRRWAVAAAFGLLYFGFHQLLDYHREPGLLFAAAFPFAYLDATAPAGPPRWHLRSPARPAFAAGAIVVAIAIAGLLLQEIPAFRQADAEAAANTGNWAAADAPARAAAAADPGISPYVFTAGLTASRAGDHAAAAGYFRVVALRDDYPEAWVDLAAEEALLGHRTAALDAITAGLRLGSQRTAIGIAAGDLALRLGDSATAVQAFANALAAGPPIGADSWWSADPDRRAALESAIPIALSIATPDAGWEIALMTGNTAQALSLAERTGNPAAARLQIAAWQDESAVADLFAACSDQPLDLELVIWCARVASRYEMPTDASRFRVLARALSSAGYTRAFDLRVWQGEPDVRLAEGRIAAIWGTFSYRRELPHDVLVSDLVHLTSLD